MNHLQAYDEASQHLHVLRNTVALVEIALNDAVDGEKEVAPHVLAAVLRGTQQQIGALEQLTNHLLQPSAPKPQPIPNPGVRLTGILRTMREESTDAEEKGHDIMPSALAHFAHLLEEAIAASLTQRETTHE